MWTGQNVGYPQLFNALASSYGKAVSSPPGLKRRLETFRSSMAAEAERAGCRPCQRVWNNPHARRFLTR